MRKSLIDKNYPEIKALVFERERETIARMAFSAQFKPKAHNLEFVFRDSKGNEYFKHADPDDIGLGRRAKIMEAVQELYMGGPIWDLIEEYREKHEEEVNANRLLGACTSMDFFFKEAQLRKSDHFLPIKSYFRLLAAAYIRQDEEPYEFDQSLWEEKAAQFEADLNEQNSVFFSPLLTEYLGITPVSSNELAAFLKESQAKQAEIDNLRETILSRARSYEPVNNKGKA